VSRVGWLDCASGVSGDMLLGALADLGALSGLDRLVESLSSLGVSVSVSPTSRAGLRASAATVQAPVDQPHRSLADVLAVIEAAEAPAAVRDRAIRVFERLAAAEANVHGVEVDEVAFHEVGAVDAIVDVLGACLGLHALGLDRLTVSPIALGGGTVQTAHGTLPVPTPAALELMTGSGLTTASGGEAELATPTGLAIVAGWAAESGPMPAMQIERVGVGAGSRDPADRPNVVRLVIGEAADPTPADDWVVVEANIDDLDPRLWPGILAKLLDAGAADVWLAPILMKKGRPAHTLSALATSTTIDAIQQAMFLETSTIGLRWYAVSKRALERQVVTVDIDGLSVRVKIAFAGGKAVSATPEFEDIAAAAAELGVPTKHVLDAANAAVRNAMTRPISAD
jgi:uncharacterized protein (TIGR00299 family) protein